jgi:hypothetical protein
MSDWQPYPLFGGAYSDDSLAWTRQDTVNYLPIRAERPGARSVAKFEMVPGMQVFANIGDGPHRGGRDVEGKCFVVSGHSLYVVTPAGVATELGTIPGTGPVSMTHNQITGGNQLVIGNGLSGYVYNTATSAFTQITDEGFPGFVSCDFLGQYILGVEPQRRFWFHSDLNAATSYNTLDRYTAESAPDRIIGLVTSHSEVLVFGERTIEPWVNDPVGNAAGTAFQRNTSAIVECGCASGNTIRRLDNSVFFLSNNGQVMRLNGYTPVPISTRAMESAIAHNNWSKAFAFTWEDRGHVCYFLTFPDGLTWCYDVAQGEWSRRESYGIAAGAARGARWRLNSLFKWNGHWWGGDYNSGKMFKLDWDFALDACDPIVRRRVGGIIHNNGNLLSLDGVRIGYNTGHTVSLPHGGATITGNLPDQSLGAVVNFQYTVVPNYPGQTATVSIGQGALPTGLTMSAAGHVTGTTTESGAFGWTVRAIDECGTPFDLPDSATVGSLSWMVAGNTANTDMRFLLTDDPMDWSGTPSSLAAAINNCYTIGSGNGQLIVTYNNGADVSSNAGATWASVSGLSTQTIAGAVFVGSHWVLPTNGGDVNRSTNGTSFTTTAVSGFGANCVTTIGMRIVGAGPWGWVSDDEGATWTKSAFIIDAFFAAHGIASDGMKAIAVGSQNKLASTLDGLTWTEIASPFTGTSEIRCIAHDAIGGNWVMVNAVGEIAYSTDGGLTFTLVEGFNLGGLPTQGGVAGYQGIFVAVSVNGGGIAASTDGGVTWALCTESFTVPSAVAVVAV